MPKTLVRLLFGFTALLAVHCGTGADGGDALTGADADGGGNGGAGRGDGGGGNGGDGGALKTDGATSSEGGGRTDGGAGGGAPSDYIYCDYGAVPSASAPSPWQDSPSLTPFGINPYGAPAKTVAYGYLLLNEGPQGVSQVPEATQRDILKRINEDLKFETELSYLHMPDWTTATGGAHYIDYFFVGTGLPNDPNAGGDQGWEGRYPMVETMAVAMTDQGQRWDLTHEFNHVLQNAYGTIDGNQVSWIHESYNDYLIVRLAEWRGGATPGQAAQFALPSNIGYLDALVYEQPYVPIESCGINGAGEATGPADYFNDTTGFRYNDLFPLFVAQRVGERVYAAVWEKAQHGEQNLQTMARLMDKSRVKCMVHEYAARLALGDFQELSASIQQRASAKMYTAMTDQGGWLVPTDAKKLPRYTGRNNIPIKVSGGATKIEVNFAPDASGSKGTPADMRAQIVYRATDGSAVFGEPVPTGTASVNLTKAPKDGVVVVVISNVTMEGYASADSFGWDPSETFGYKIQVSGGAPAPTNRLYF